MDNITQIWYDILIMNPPKCNEYDYISFLTASPKVFTCTEAGKVQPDRKDGPPHDSTDRLLLRLPADTASLIEESSRFVTPDKGVLISDDFTPDKPYARKIGLVIHHSSGKHHKVVRGINLVSMLWSDGDAHIPCDFGIYDKAGDDKTKNDHFSGMLSEAKARGFEPECVLFDSWYASLDNLKKSVISDGSG